jgi:regulator of protease activity HflC (stomatin/prohibitin superfamily)
MIQERSKSALSGWLALAILVPLFGFALYSMIQAFERQLAFEGIFWLLVVIVSAFCLGGLFVVNPNQGVVLQLFGDYAYTAKNPGLRWANPFYSKKRLSLRVRNFESEKLKVNDADGNPVEIAAVVVWKVVDTAEASFEVDDYEHYVRVQSEAAVRNLATHYPYDAHDEAQISLRSNTAAVAENLKTQIQARLEKAGVRVLEARLSHLAYAPEIAAAMLQRQQASAIIAARQKIVEGAVGMVEMALARLQRQKVVEMDEERKAVMVSNLLVVLCGERAAQPVLNTGSLYQ